MIKNLKKVINANGRMTLLGVSTFNNEVAEAMKEAGQKYIVMKDFKNEINKNLINIIGAKNCHVVNSASAGIALSVAATIYEKDIYNVNKNIQNYNNKIIIPKGHNVDYGAPIESMISLVGGEVTEAGWANRCAKIDVINKIDDRTSALMYVVSHHCVTKGILSLDEMIEISKEFKLPLIVDAAAENDFRKYAKKDISVVIFSGAKAIEGPTSGIVFGKDIELIENIKEHSNIIGRAMKIGKENIAGLLKAIENYKIKSIKNVDEYLTIFTKIHKSKAEIIEDERKIKRIKLTFDNSLDIVKLNSNLINGEVAIYLRGYLANQSILEVDLRSINIEEAKIIVVEINKQIMEK